MTNDLGSDPLVQWDELQYVVYAKKGGRGGRSGSVVVMEEEEVGEAGREAILTGGRAILLK